MRTIESGSAGVPAPPPRAPPAPPAPPPPPPPASPGDRSASDHRSGGKGRTIGARATGSAGRGAPTTATPSPASHPPVRRHDDHIILALEVAGVQVVRIHPREWDLEVLQLETRPSRRHRAAQAIHQ